VKRVLIEEGLDIKRELYLGLLVDRASGLPVFMASAAGGMEIEEVARIIRSYSARDHSAVVGLNRIRRARSLLDWGCRECPNTRHAVFSGFVSGVYLIRTHPLLEINPCVLTGDGKLVALDAR